MNASGPPIYASGETWPIMEPWLNPEKRPSEIRATFDSSPFSEKTVSSLHQFIHTRRSFDTFVP